MFANHGIFSEYKYLDNNKRNLFNFETIDSSCKFTWYSHPQCGFNLSTETLTSILPKKSKLSHKGFIKKETNFINVDKSKLIGIPITKDGMIQIIADKETNL